MWWGGLHPDDPAFDDHGEGEPDGCLGCVGLVIAIVALIVLFGTLGCSSPTEPDDCELFVNGERVAEWACEEEE
jgi:hypothetical protein